MTNITNFFFIEEGKNSPVAEISVHKRLQSVIGDRFWVITFRLSVVMVGWGITALGLTVYSPNIYRMVLQVLMAGE